jgi:branched-subunit amino acid aminotransferase/4-amino-4-deoxychorismate lyase
MREDVMTQTGATECRLRVADVMVADEVFLSNSLGLQAVIAIDGTPVGAAHPGAVFQALRKRLG